MTPPPRDRGQTTKSDDAYDLLRQAIITGEIEPNAALDEAAVADAFGFGRTPCREALKRLTFEHFLVWPRRRAPYVRGITAKEQQRLHEARLTLETRTAQLAAERVTARELDRLDAIVADMERAAAAREIYKVVRGDEALHHGIADASDNRFLAEAVAQLNLGSLRLWYDAMSQQDISDVAHDHQQLVDALRSREPDRAAGEMAGHIRQYYDRQLALLALSDRPVVTGAAVS